MDPAAQRVAVGRVRGLHGLRGAVRVEVLTDRPAERFAAGARVLAGERVLTVVEAAQDGPGLRVHFAEVADRTAAESLRDLDLEVEVDRERDLEPGAVFWHELRGVRVTDVDGRDLGTVRDVYRAGGAEVIAVAGGVVRPFEMPVVHAFIRAWRPREGSIVVDADALDLAPAAAADREPATG
ncbi:MAG: ribosome maturation factor RimM [Chloroflexi bacterium]|nr:ribosome maturation factor RimM [Chloroflexota bacterium]